MPHYANGTQAHVGDHVVGKLYNTPGRRAGTVVSITPGVDSCNCMVQFTMSVSAAQWPTDVDAMCAAQRAGTFPQMAAHDPDGKPIARIVRAEAHGTDGEQVYHVTCQDYCAINELHLVESAVADGEK